jgi:hypothetical protein
MKMMTERYRGIQVRLMLPFRFLTPFFALCFRLLRNSPRPWVKHARIPASPVSLKPSAQKAKSSISLQPYLNPPIEWQENDFLTWMMNGPGLQKHRNFFLIYSG